MSSTTAASSRDKAVEGLLVLTSSSFSANGGNKVEDGISLRCFSNNLMKAFIIMVFNSLMLVMIKLLVRLLIS